MIWKCEIGFISSITIRKVLRKKKSNQNDDMIIITKWLQYHYSDVKSDEWMKLVWKKNKIFKSYKIFYFHHHQINPNTDESLNQLS